MESSSQLSYDLHLARASDGNCRTRTTDATARADASRSVAAPDLRNRRSIFQRARPSNFGLASGGLGQPLPRPKKKPPAVAENKPKRAPNRNRGAWPGLPRKIKDRTRKLFN